MDTKRKLTSREVEEKIDELVQQWMNWEITFQELCEKAKPLIVADYHNITRWYIK